ncbi:zinc ribbon domain-containing protein [Haloplanus rallus]|uniref:zinc ribbon domain-containing protein n=1 Tax=Haloplanus rallus TaxID=1816183 RepID=UPI0018EE76E6|nr:hypothetical protein [Haloplanus rallus]
MKDDSQRADRGLHVCEECGLVANADVTGAENIRQKVLPNLACDGRDGDNDWMAQQCSYKSGETEDTSKSPTQSYRGETISGYVVNAGV